MRKRHRCPQKVSVPLRTDKGENPYVGTGTDKGKSPFVRRQAKGLYRELSVPCATSREEQRLQACLCSLPGDDDPGFVRGLKLEVIMNFFLAMIPPTATAQERKVKVVKNKPVFYDPPAVRTAREQLTAYLGSHRPAEPMKGPVELRVLWLFPKGSSHRHGEWRVTKPDTDNLQKLLKDCMTKTGFWEDDAQVVREVAEKRWSDEPCGIYIEVETIPEVEQ